MKKVLLLLTVICGIAQISISQVSIFDHVNKNKNTNVLDLQSEFGRESGLCINNLYQYGCVGSYGRIIGLASLSLSNIDIPRLPCDGMSMGYFDYTDSTHFQFVSGVSYLLNTTIDQFDNDVRFNVWIDFNDDLQLTNDELLLESIILQDIYYANDIIAIPVNTSGQHLMRIRSRRGTGPIHPCQTIDRGNCFDFIADISQPENEISVFSILSPVSAPVLGMEEVTILVNNGGSSAQTDINISYSIDGNSPVYETIPGTIATGELVEFTFATLADLTSLDVNGQSFNIEVCTHLPADEIPGNDCSTESITVYPIIELSADAFVQTLKTGETQSQLLAISNNGNVNLEFLLNIQDGVNLNESLWLSASQSSGIISPGESNEIEINFNAKDVSLGSYTASLIITNNDLSNEYINIPVHLHVYDRNNNDVGIREIIAPQSGELMGMEQVSVVVKNYGKNPQSNIPVSYVLNNLDFINETIPGTLAPGMSVEYTFTQLANLQAQQTTEFTLQDCTNLLNDDNQDNDCEGSQITNLYYQHASIEVLPLQINEDIQTGNVISRNLALSNNGDMSLNYSINIELSDSQTENRQSGLCTENLYTEGCEYGDGITYWNLANILINEIPCTGSPAWYHDYTDSVHHLTAGNSYVLSVKIGFDIAGIDVWIDFNNDLQLTEDELVIDDGIVFEQDVEHFFDINIPENVINGSHLMRIRERWADYVYDPCETYDFGNCCDFTVDITGGVDLWISTDVAAGIIQPDESADIVVTINATQLEAGYHDALLKINSNDPVKPQIMVPVHVRVFDTNIPFPFNVSGGGEYCAGSIGAEIMLEDSEVGVVYTLYKNDIPLAPDIAGTGNPISFGYQLQGDYYITGTNGTNTSFMTGAAIISEQEILTPSISIWATQNPAFSGQLVSFIPDIVNGGDEVTFNWFVNEVIFSTSDFLQYIPENGDIVYASINSSLSCVSNDLAESNQIEMIVYYNMPIAFEVSGTGRYCEGEPGLMVSLTGSEPGITYTLYRNNIALEPSIIGTGLPVTFGIQTTGIYTVEGSNPQYTTSMFGNAVIEELENLPLSVTISPEHEPVCSGNAIIFYANTQNAGESPTYQWYRNNQAVVGANANSFQFNPADGDAIYVEVNSSYECSTNSPVVSDVYYVELVPTVTAEVSITESNNNICDGESVTFTATPVNGGADPTYFWKVNFATFESNSPAYTYIPSHGDQVSVIMVPDPALPCVSNSTGAKSNLITMIVNETVTPAVAIVASENPVLAGVPVTFTPTPVNGGTPTYQWFVNGTYAGTVTPYTYIPEDGDQIYSEMASSLECITAAIVVSNTILMDVITGININDIPGLKVYSFDKVIYLESTTGLTGEAVVYDVAGRKLITRALLNETKTLIPASALSNGVYIVKVSSGDSQFNTKVFVR